MILWFRKVQFHQVGFLIPIPLLVDCTAMLSPHSKMIPMLGSKSKGRIRKGDHHWFSTDIFCLSLTFVGFSDALLHFQIILPLQLLGRGAGCPGCDCVRNQMETKEEGLFFFLKLNNYYVRGYCLLHFFFFLANSQPAVFHLSHL